MLRARLIAGVPADLVGSLTGLTEGRFPVAARARYADDLAERKLKHAKRGQNAANVVESNDARRGIAIFAHRGSPVVAVNDGVVKRIGRSRRLGHYVVLQDVYGNRYMYAHLASVARYYPVPKRDAVDPRSAVRALRAHPDPRPHAPATAGRQAPTPHPRHMSDLQHEASTAVKDRLFAHPDNPLSRDNGGLDQQLEHVARLEDFET